MAVTADGAVAADKHWSSAARERAEQWITPILRSKLADTAVPRVPRARGAAACPVGPVRAPTLGRNGGGTLLDHGHADGMFE